MVLNNKGKSEAHEYTRICVYAVNVYLSGTVCGRAMSLVLAIIMRVIDITDCPKSEKIEDHENSTLNLRKTVAWPLFLRHDILRNEQGIFNNNANGREK